MRSSAEALLAVVLTVALGVGFWLFSGQSLSERSQGTAVPIVIDFESAARGEALAAETGCFACHTSDGTPGSGPTWKGLSGSSRLLDSGVTLTADEDYLRRSIADPLADVVAGFNPVMPTTYSDQLTEAEVDDLVEYIKRLGS